ncbi:ATP-binding protein [Alcaligenes nematophilus]|uniref:ATP-binding protein n=1 Tax=Alcaligenes nematophilus TaxID=2994643 RepID=UPI00384CF289
MKTIFIAGIHGVGKSFMCKKIAIQGIYHASASDIIKSELKEENWGKEKNVKDAINNQTALIKGLKKIEKKTSNLILDGHFTLISNNEIIEINQSVFDEIKPKSIILITDDEEKIIEKIKKRDGKEPTYDVSKFLKAEKQASEEYAKKNGIDWDEIQSGEIEEMKKLVNHIFYGG